MALYRNLNGDSGVHAYELGNNNIVVQFNDGSAYLYNYSVPGSSAVEHMKQLALNGSGLNSYISKSIKKRYAAKFR